MTAIYNCFAYEEKGRKVIRQTKMSEIILNVFNTHPPFKNSLFYQIPTIISLYTNLIQYQNPAILNTSIGFRWNLAKEFTIELAIADPANPEKLSEEGQPLMHHYQLD
jgi:hypothetical protein